MSNHREITRTNPSRELTTQSRRSADPQIKKQSNSDESTFDDEKRRFDRRVRHFSIEKMIRYELVYL